MLPLLLILQTGDAAPALRAEPVETPATERGVGISLAEAPGGAALLSWMQPGAGDAVELRVARRGPDGAWGEAERVAAGDDWFVNWADFPQASAGPRGSALAAWLAKRGDAVYAYAPRIAVRNPEAHGEEAAWHAAGWLPTDDTPTEHGFVALQPLPGGGWGAAWLDGRHEDAMSLYAVRVSASGVVEGEARLDGRTCECCQTDAVMLPDGRMLIAYRDRSAEEVRDVALVHGRPGEPDSWSAPRVPCPDGWVFPGCPVNGPALAAHGEVVALAWFTLGDDETPRVRIAFSADGGATFGEPLRVDAGDPLGRVDLRFLDADTAVVTWLEEDDDGASWRARAVLAGAAPAAGDAIVLGRVAGNRVDGFLRMAAVSDGLLAAWPRPGEGRPGAALLRRDAD